MTYGNRDLKATARRIQSDLDIRYTDALTIAQYQDQLPATSEQDTGSLLNVWSKIVTPRLTVYSESSEGIQGVPLPEYLELRKVHLDDQYDRLADNLHVLQVYPKIMTVIDVRQFDQVPEYDIEDVSDPIITRSVTTNVIQDYLNMDLDERVELHYVKLNELRLLSGQQPEGNRFIKAVLQSIGLSHRSSIDH